MSLEDGSAEGGVECGGSGVLFEWPDGTRAEVRAPAGSLGSSHRSVLIALRAAIGHLLEQDPVKTRTNGTRLTNKTRSSFVPTLKRY